MRRLENLSCIWTAFLLGLQKRFSLLTKINRYQRQHEIEMAQPKKQRASSEQAATLVPGRFQDFHRDFQFYNNRPNLLPRYFRNTMNLWRKSLCGVTCGHFTSHLLCMFVCSFFFFFFLLCLFSTRSAPTRKLVLSVKNRIVLRRFIYTVSTIFVM